MTLVSRDIPMAITIGGMLYRVDRCEILPCDDCVGAANYTQQRILITGDAPADFARRVLLHEAIHVIDYQHGTELTEQQVVALENGLWNLLRDNPGIWGCGE